MTHPKVLVLGAGNAGLCAAIAASEQGADVTVLEAAPLAERGGNSRFTAGAMRVVYNGVEDLRKLIPDLIPREEEQTDFGQYTEADFMDDLARVTEYRCDPDLVETLVKQSLPTLLWMGENGVRFVPVYGRQALMFEGKYTFWGGLTVEASGGGPGLVDTLAQAGERRGVEILYEHRAVSLLDREGSAGGVEVVHRGQRLAIEADAVVLASGGFEANTEWRSRYLGPGWDLARVRGSRFNMGEGIKMALEFGAMPWGHWSGCHAVGWDRNAPEVGNLAVGDGYQKHSYPFGIMVNSRGERFLDEGADFRNYTYAKYGAEILRQPGQFAWQVFDSKVSALLREEYRIKEVSKVTADTLEDLAKAMDGVDGAGFLRTVEEFNRAVETDVSFNPNVKDGRGTVGLAVDKSNWANTLSDPPFEAYAVTCGITFTFGGVRADPAARVLGVDGEPIKGLYACGELLGGIFYFNYPGGSGLTSGAVFGRIAGTEAGRVKRR